MESFRRRKIWYYCRHKVGGLDNLVHAECEPDQEALSPLWFAKEISKENKGKYRSGVQVPSHLVGQKMLPKYYQSICCWSLAFLIFILFISVGYGACP